MNELKLTEFERKILTIIDDHQGIRARQISDRYVLNYYSVSRTTCRLEKKGLVKKFSNLADMRETIIQVTELGKRLLEIY